VEAGFIHMVEDFAMQLIGVCRMFMRTKDVIAIAGKHQEFMVKTFEASDLDAIKKVRINLGNPFAKTQAGRVEIATQLLNAQQIDGTQYMNIVSTGQIGQYLEPKVAEEAYLTLENEQLMSGQMPITSPLDNHIKHIKAHHALLALPNIRAESKLLALVLEHITEHVDIMTQLSIDNPTMFDISIGAAAPRLPTAGPNGLVGGDPSQLPGQQQGQEAAAQPQDQGASIDIQAQAEKGQEMAQNKLQAMEAGNAPSDVPR
jgi:hypothetical protein